MTSSMNNLSASEAANRLGVSAKALRLYEQKGLLTPKRTTAGYRIYSPDDMVLATKIVNLRGLGLSLAQVAQVFGGEPQALQRALVAHESLLHATRHQLTQRIEKVQTLNADLMAGHLPDSADLNAALCCHSGLNLAFSLPWPWGGEWFEIRDVRPLNYIVGPLGSGKTVLAKCIANAVPGGVFLSMGRDNKSAQSEFNDALRQDDASYARVRQALAWLADEGATMSAALTALLRALEDDVPGVLVVDLMEDNLDEATQVALMRYLRSRASLSTRPLFMTTRSAVILDVDCVGADEAIYSCPANHNRPFRVLPYPGAAGYEAIVSCLASPSVRARTQGMIAMIPKV